MGFNVTEYEMFIDMVSDSKFQLSFKKLLFVENSLVVQSIRLCVSTAGGMGFTPGLVIKVQQAMQHGQNKCMRARAHARTHTHTHTHTHTCQWRRYGFDTWVGKIPWRRKWLPTSVFLPGTSHGQSNLVGYSPWSCKESGTTKQLNMPACT